jgi:hypothetical protein
LSLLFLAVALSLPAQVMIIYGHGFNEIGAVFDKLTWLNDVVMAGCLVCSVLVFRASPILRPLVPFMIVLVALNNYVVGYYATDYSMWAASAGTFGFAFLNLPLLHPRLQWLMLHPEKRWWMRAERKRVQLPVTIEGTRLQPMRNEIFDISESGAFVSGVGKDMRIGDWITVRMKFGMFTHVRCQAKIVRRAEAMGDYPRGIGVQFMNMNWRERASLRRCIEREPEAPR